MSRLCDVSGLRSVISMRGGVYLQQGNYPRARTNLTRVLLQAFYTVWYWSMKIGDEYKLGTQGDEKDANLYA